MKIKEFVDSNKSPVNKSILNELFVMDSEIPINMMGIKGCPKCKDQSNQTQLEAGSWTSAYACYNCNSIFFISWTDRMGGSHTDHVLIYKEKSSLLDKKLDNDVNEPIVSKEPQDKHYDKKNTNCKGCYYFQYKSYAGHGWCYNSDSQYSGKLRGNGPSCKLNTHKE